jgi:hypothetical protein
MLLYAAAVHHVTGLPVYFLGGGHAIMKSPKGWLDEAGIHPVERDRGMVGAKG